MAQSDSDSTPPSSGFPFSPEEALQFMQRMWNPFGVPMPGFSLPGTAPAAAVSPAPGMNFPNPANMFATLDPAELDRKIGELRIIENWLQMSLNLMQMSIKTMELQKAALETLRTPQGMTNPTPEGSRKGEQSRKK